MAAARARKSTRSAKKATAKRATAKRKTAGVTAKPTSRTKGRQPGCVAAIEVCETVGRHVDRIRKTVRVAAPIAGVSGRSGGGGVGLSDRVCRVMAAMGHTTRAKLMTTLLRGPADHATLQQATKVAAGPLYHHVNQLRLAGLIRPKQRNTYELTRGGRNMILTAMALGSIVADARRRPHV